MNGQGIYCWDADAVPWTTAQLVISLSINLAANDAPSAGSYVTHWTNVCSFSHTFTFTRSAFLPAMIDTGVSSDTFALYTGITPVGDGATVPPFFRSLVATLIGNSLAEITSPTITGSWTLTYTGGGAPPNTSGGSTVDFNLQLDATLAGTNLLWTYGFDLPDFGSYPFVGTDFGTGIAGGFLNGSGVTIDLLNWKTAGNVDTGGTDTWAPVNPGSGATYNITAWTATRTATLTTS